MEHSARAPHRLQVVSSHLPRGGGMKRAAAAGEDEAFLKYCEEGRARALALGNRGPLRFGADGRVAQDILDAYWRHGFYVLEGVVSDDELRDIRTEVEEVLAGAPSAPGQPAKAEAPHLPPAPGTRTVHYQWVRPLSDPSGGTSFGVHNFAGGETKGRHPMKMREPAPPPGAPAHIIQGWGQPLIAQNSALRLYAHPSLLRVAEALNGPDFTPFTESLFYKPARLGTSTAWHQDPSAAWDDAWGKPGFDPGTCGFSFHLSVYNCTAENALWMLPGSHHTGRVDVKALSASGDGSDRLPGAVPIICKAGDVYIQNRMPLHGSFANTSPEKRCTLQFGFQRRRSVLNVRTKGYRFDLSPDWEEKLPTKIYDDAYIRERSKMIMWAIDARKQKYPDEVPYKYVPFAGQEHEYRWSEQLREGLYGKYWMKDIVI